MNLVFFGDDEYSLIVLTKLFKASPSQIQAVITRRPKPEGRNGILTPSPVEQFANTHNLLVLYYSKDISDQSKIIEHLKLRPVEVGVLASFGYILPQSILDLIPRGIINIHPSLLPQYRGATPVQYAIAMGDKTTGVTLFPITAKVDLGKPLAQVSTPIDPQVTAPQLLTHLFGLGSDLLLELLGNNLQPLPMESLPTSPTLYFTRRFTRDTGLIEWNTFLKAIEGKPIRSDNTANELLKLRLEKKLSHDISDPQSMIQDLSRALTPWPGVWTKAPTKSGVRRLIIHSVKPEVLVQIEGKPNPIPYKEFTKYYAGTHDRT